VFELFKIVYFKCIQFIQMVYKQLIGLTITIMCSSKLSFLEVDLIFLKRNYFPILFKEPTGISPA